MFKRIMSYILSTALIFESSMVWGQKPANPPHILYDSAKEYMKDTGFDKKNITFGEWFKKAKKYLDPEVGGKMEAWVKLNSNKRMPTFEIARGKKTDDKITLNVTAKLDGKSLSFEVVQTETEVYFVIDHHKYAYADLYYGNILDKVYGSSPFISAHKIRSTAKTHPRTAGKYLKALKSYLVAYEQYQDVFLTGGKPKKVSLWEQLLPTSYAKGSSGGASCLIAGWPVGTLSEKNGSCEDTGNYHDNEGYGPKNSNDCLGAYHCNPTIFGDGTCVPLSTFSVDVSRKCESSSTGKIEDTVKKIYDDENYKTIQGIAKESFNNVFNVCFGSGSEVTKKINAAINNTNRKQADYALDKIENNLQVSLTRPIAARCNSVKLKLASDCNEHNRNACNATITRIIALIREAKSQPTPDPGCTDYVECKTTRPDGTVVTTQACGSCTPSGGTTLPIVAQTTGETTPEATGPLPQETAPASQEENSPGFFDSIGNFWNDHPSLGYITAGLVGFGAGFLLCRFWACKDAITKTVTNTVQVPVPVPGPTQYVPVPGPTQYFVLPEIPVPITVPEETVIDRAAGTGAR
jgi:hypothetical protein